VLFADERPWKLQILISCFGLSCFMYRGLAGKPRLQKKKRANGRHGISMLHTS